MSSDAPPTYEKATAQPQLNVTNPQGQTSPAQPGRRGNNLERVASNRSDASDISTGYEPVGDEDTRRSMDDERRDLPEGWVRCFDPKTEHAFYVDEKTKRSTWLHPYDDPEYLQSLPRDHPANPNSEAAKRAHEQAQQEEALARKLNQDREGSKPAGKKADRKADETEVWGPMGPGASVGGSSSRAKGADKEQDGDRNWFQRKKDHLIGTKEERAQHKEEKRKAKAEQKRREEEAYRQYTQRRQELLQKQLNDPNIRRYYASDPYMYSAPMSPYSRAGGLYSPIGYGYGGGYGRRYGGFGYPGYGYGGMGMGMGGAGLGLGAGLLGGVLLGDALGGGFDGGYGGGFDGGGGGFDGGGGGGDGGGGGM